MGPSESRGFEFPAKDLLFLLHEAAARWLSTGELCQNSSSVGCFDGEGLAKLSWCVICDLGTVIKC